MGRAWLSRSPVMFVELFVLNTVSFLSLALFAKHRTFFQAHSGHALDLIMSEFVVAVAQTEL